MRAEIRVAGFGGQGVITFGYVLAQAASIHDEKYSLMTQSYGPEARGGACCAQVIIFNKYRAGESLSVIKPPADSYRVLF